MTLSVIGNLAILVMLLLFLYRLQQTHVSFTRRVFSGLGLGVLFGWALQLLYGVGSEVLVQTGDYLDLVGSGYVKLLQMIIIPLIMVSIIGAILKLSGGTALGKISAMTIGVLIFTTMIAAGAGILMSNLFGLTAEGLVQGSAETARLTAIQTNYVGKVADLTVPQMVLSFIPKNPFADLTGANPTSIISIVIFSAFLGVAALKLLKEDVEKGQRVLTAIDTLQGWVITFRDRNEINALTAQLSQVKRYVDNLRIMRHEQLNRMTTLSGLLHMGHYDEAIRYIQAQSEHAQELLDFISSRFSSPTLCGLLLGKAARAREKGVELSFDPACRLDRPFLPLGEQELISIIGNLLDNAVDATLKAPVPAPVELYISDRNQELLIEVADRGCGVDDALKPHIFRQGFSSKPDSENDIVGTEHGIGLFLVAGYIDKAGGSIEIADNTPQGTIFSVFIPNGQQHDPTT